MLCSRISKSRSLTFSKAPPDNAETQTHTAKHTPAYSLGNLKEAIQRHRRTEAAPGGGLCLGASPGPWPIHTPASGRPNQAVMSVLWLEYPVSLKEKIFKHTTKCPLKTQTLSSVLFRSLFHRGNEVDWGIPGRTDWGFPNSTWRTYVLDPSEPSLWINSEIILMSNCLEQ